MPGSAPASSAAATATSPGALALLLDALAIPPFSRLQQPQMEKIKVALDTRVCCH